MRKLLTTAALSIGLVAASAQAAPSATIDWEKRVIVARGQGAPDLNAPNPAAARIGAERAAELDAFRNILETLKGVQVEGGATAGSLMQSDSVLRASVEGALHQFKIVDRRYFSDGGVELDVQMPLDGRVTELLIPKPASGEVAKLSTTGVEVGSGLVVLAKGLKVKAALAPRIMDEAGKEVYGPDFVQPGALRSNGIAGYLKSVPAAEQSARVGAHPVQVKALRTSASGSDLVISNADAARLTDPKSNLGFLAEAKVIIVTD
jgi:hypothetical protein